MDYRYKYKKYKHKYLKQIGSANDLVTLKRGSDHWEDLIDTFLQRLEKENINRSLVEDIFDFFEKSLKDRNEYDMEQMHMLEDDLAVKFIKNVAEKTIIDIDSIQNIASLIKKINDLDAPKWYV